MRMARASYVGIVAVAIAVLLTASQLRSTAQPTADPAIRIGSSDLGGRVTSANGPEAGVWVIAETTDLPTRVIKIVATDDRGRYVIPELPESTYRVRVLGEGLV